MVTYVPVEEAESVKSALHQAGAGEVGNYSNCSFSTEGVGSFKPSEGTNPTLGEIGKVHHEKEVQINMIYSFEKEAHILKALFKNHPYEEVAYEILTLENTNFDIGMGMIGELKSEMEEEAFLKMVKARMNASVVRYSKLRNKKVKKVAVLGGSGAFAIAAAKKAKADVFVTSDIKYHEFYQAEGQLVIADIGHFETEQFTKELLVDYLIKKIPNFAVALSESITNPIKYL